VLHEARSSKECLLFLSADANIPLEDRLANAFEIGSFLGEYMEAKTKTCYLIDGHNLFYKAHFAFLANPLVNSRGENTSVIFGVIRMLNVIIKEYAPHYLAFVLDSPTPTFRKSIFADYKSTRPPMPQEIIVSIPRVVEILRAYGITVLQTEGYEADDLLATAARKLTADGFSVFIVSGDKDLCQVVDENVRILSTRKGLTELELIDSQAVQERFGVQPSQIPDFLSLMGDTADNIPGVRGIGEKTAAKLLYEFPTVEQLIAQADKISKHKWRDLITQHIPTIRLSKFLAQVRYDVPIEVNSDTVLIKPSSRYELQRIFHDLEFHQLSMEIAPEDSNNHHYRLITNLDEFTEILLELQAVESISVISKSVIDSLKRIHLLGIALAWADGCAAYLPISSAAVTDLTTSPCWSKLKDMLAGEFPSKVTNNAKKLMHDCTSRAVAIGGLSLDTALAGYLLKPGRNSYSVDALSFEYFNTKVLTENEILEQLTKGATLDVVPAHQVMLQACQEADYCRRLGGHLRERLRSARLENLYNSIELPLVSILWEIENAGIMVDADSLRILSERLSAELNRIDERIVMVTGTEFNAKSPKQVNDVLFNKMKFPTAGLKKTRWGVSTDEDALRSLLSGVPERDEIVHLLLEHRSLSKIKDTYADVLPSLVNPRSGRIHTSFNQFVVETGRLSSSNPNLQNIPVRGEWGRIIRNCFVAPPGSLLVSADYSQIELRILAHLANDPDMIRAFHEDQDIHANTAARVFGVNLEEVTPELRRIAKAVNFGIDYGMTAFGLATRLGMGRQDAQQIIDDYFARYPKIAEFIAATAAWAEQHGYVTTMLGRRRYLNQIWATRKDIQEAEKRKAINMPIQGTAADIVKLAMIELDRFFRAEQSSAKMILQVHDEILFEIAEVDWPALDADIRRIMEHVLSLSVPLKVSINAGKRWGDIH